MLDWPEVTAGRLLGRSFAVVGEMVPAIILGVEAWIVRLGHPGRHAGAQLGEGGGVGGLIGNIGELVRITAYVVEFLSGTFAEVERDVLCIRRIGLVGEEKILRCLR